MNQIEKLAELERRLYARTISSTDPPLTWVSHWVSGTYEWAGGKGSVEVGPDRIRVLDDRGREDCSFTPETDRLYQGIKAAHDKLVGETIDRILDDLDKAHGSADLYVPAMVAVEDTAPERRRWWRW